ncbi:MAG: hypothetical protein MUE46_03115 [Xanthomonadales bacterium]|jgi:hypothetical protein|nr:hypothetical protein [Xanthomonadales bacterium]
MSQRHRVTLSADQQAIVDRLTRLTVGQLDELARISHLRKQANDNPSVQTDAFAELKEPRKPNAVGIFGRRGSGKSTIQAAVLEKLAKPDPEKAHGWLVLNRPLDLSYAPSEFPHGLTLIHWLHERLRSEATPCKPPCSQLGANFDKAAQSYFRGSDGFNKLVRNLALSPEHYANSAAKEISWRLSLHTDLQTWLDAEAANHKVRGFVVAVDDADLPPANRHHSLIWSLLDELHQDRLFFILAGDLKRLRERLANEDVTVHRGHCAPRLDPRVANDLIYKVAPTLNRENLQPWVRNSRSSFPPGRQDNIGALLQQSAVDAALQRHLPALLPPWVRGLENAWKLLRSHVHSDGPNKASLPPETLIFFAEFNFESTLAEQLRERTLGDWAGGFRWESGNTSHVALWDQLRERLKPDMDVASDRPRTNIEDLPELLPVPQKNWLDLEPRHARFAEALIDIALEQRTLSPERLVERIPWLYEHYRQSSSTVLRDLSDFDRDLQAEPIAAAAALYWIEFTADLASASVGFAPVMDLQLGKRKRVPKGIADLEPIGLAALVRARADKGDQKRFLDLTGGSVRELLPYRDCRSLLKLADMLAQQPWTILDGTSSGVGFVGLARMAALLSYHAYLLAEGVSMDSKPVLKRVIFRLDDDPGTLTDALLEKQFRAVLEESDGMRVVLSGSASHGTGLLLQAPWFRGLA